MVKNSQILNNLKNNKDFHGFLRGSIFMKYPKVQASDATQAFINGRDVMRARLFNAGDIAHATTLENILNTAAENANFEKALKNMTSKIIQRMISAGEEGVESGADNVNINDYVDYRGGTSFARKSTALNQAYSVWKDGKSKGIQYTNITGAIGGGSYGNAEIGSAYDFLYQLNNGILTEADIQKMTKGFYDVSNLNGEILERVIEAVGQTCFKEGSQFGSEQTQELLNIIGSMDVTSKTAGQNTRHVELDLGTKQGAIVFDSQGKVDANIQIPDAEGKIGQMNISAKSVGRLNSTIKLLTGGNLMGLFAGAGLANQRMYSALTVYTGGQTYSEQNVDPNFKEMLLYQALAGTTNQIDDFANYIVFQVGTSSVQQHFRVIPMSMMLSSDNINLHDYTQLRFAPNPLPIGANTYIQKANGDKLASPSTAQEYRYPRTEATFNHLFNAKVSVLLRSGFLKQLFVKVMA